MTLKILNLYAGIGSNRKLWTGDIKVTAVEWIPEIAEIYKKFFPEDEVIVTDAHQYLQEHFKEFDFIWSSPPCPTHSKMRLLKHEQNSPDVFPDMKLYEEVIFLKHWFDGNWVIENVIGYYEPLVKPFVSGNHYFWSNKIITDLKQPSRNIIRLSREESINSKAKEFDIDVEQIDEKLRRKVLNNCVTPELGLHVFNCVQNKKQVELNFND